MKKYYVTFLLSGFSCFAFSQNSACSVNISATDTVVCEGDSVSLFATTYGPDNLLMASNTAGNNHRGNMFDIVATNDVTILSFDASPMGNTTIEVYYKVGTWNGFANSPAAWTLIGSAPVSYTGGFVPVDVPVNITIPAGQTYAFYVTSTDVAVALNYSNGTNVGNVYSADANITFLEGGGMEYPFTQGTGAVYQPRVWNGNIHYALVDEVTTTYTWGLGELIDSVSYELSSSDQFTVESTITGCPNTLYDTLDIIVSIPSVDAGSDFSVCEGDSTTLNVSGVFDYSWNNSVVNGESFLPISSSEYIVIATDSAGCTALDTINVGVNALPMVDAGENQIVCQGGDISLNGSGASIYQWDNGVLDNVSFYLDSSMIFHVIGTDENGCQNNDSIEIQVLSFDAQPITVSAGAILIANPGQGVSYQWINCATNELIDSEVHQAFVPQQNGSYAVILTSTTNSCVDTTDCVAMNSVGLSENQLTDNVSIYPNPNTGSFTIVSPENATIEISDINGRIIERLESISTKSEIELNEDSGIYLVKITKNGNSILKRVTIQ